MAHIGTGVQLAAIGPENEYLDLSPEVNPFVNVTARSTRFAAESVEELPLQTVGFGSTAIFEIPPRADLLGDMHLECRIPALQPLLGRDLPPFPEPVPTGPAVASSDPFYTGPLFTFGSSQLAAYGATGWYEVTSDGVVGVWEGGGFRWALEVRNDNRVISTLLSGPSELTLQFVMMSPGAEEVTLTQRPGTSLVALVTPQGLVEHNDTWQSPLGYMLVRRLRFMVDDIVVDDHERMWYNLRDLLTVPKQKADGLAEMLGTGLSMGADHTVMVPLKFMCCAAAPEKRVFFPQILVTKSRVRVELQVASFAECVSALTLPATAPTRLDVKLVVDHIMVEADERNSLFLNPPTIMYECVQDMDATNYRETSEGTVARCNTATVDLSELNLPVRSLVWVVYRESVPRPFEYLDAVERATLLFGSTERAEGTGNTFKLQEVWDRMAVCPSPSSNVFAYSFALRVWGPNPCGTLNFSLMQKPVLRLELSPQVATQMQLKCKVWGVAYNWLQFKRGSVKRVFSV